MAVQQTTVQWLQSLPIPWLYARVNGAAWAAGWGGEVDSQIEILKFATEARMPDRAPVDALPHIAGDSGLIISQFETEANVRTRLRTRWDDWARAGQPAEMLAQLYWGGFGGAVLVIQAGLAYTLSAPPVAGEDPTSLLQITTLPDLPTPATLFPAPQREPINASGTTAAFSPAGSGATRVITTKTIPAGNPWWTIDSRTDLTNRFQLLWPSGAPSFITYGIATFDGSTDTVEVAWNNNQRFSDSSYLTFVAAPVVTSGSPPASVWEDATARTKLGTTIKASAPFVGTVFALAWLDGDNPIANVSEGDLNRLRAIVKRWKPAATRWAGGVVLVEGRYWGWPIARWGDAGLKWGSSATVFYEGA